MECQFDADRLLFRRQFILGPRFVDGLPGWLTLSIGDRHCLTVHPDLGVCQESAGRRTLTLLGYLLDPDNPQASNQDLLRRLVRLPEGHAGWNALLARVAMLGGRWLLLVSEGNAVRAG